MASGALQRPEHRRRPTPSRHRGATRGGRRAPMRCGCTPMPRGRSATKTTAAAQLPSCSVAASPGKHTGKRLWLLRSLGRETCDARPNATCSPTPSAAAATHRCSVLRGFQGVLYPENYLPWVIPFDSFGGHREPKLALRLERPGVCSSGGSQEYCSPNPPPGGSPCLKAPLCSCQEFDRPTGAA
jgi:hypothetical protein